jgi:hypothetical protein
MLVMAVFAASPALAQSRSSWQIQALEVTGTAQFGPQSPSPEALARLDDRLSRARMVRISTPPGLIEAAGVRAGAEGLAYSGIVSSTRGDTLPAPGTVKWDAILEAQVPGSHAGRGAKIGAALLGVMGLLTGMAAANIGVEEDNTAGTAAAGAVGAGVGLLTGAGLGALIGAPFHTWKRVYPNHH